MRNPLRGRKYQSPQTKEAEIVVTNLCYTVCRFWRDWVSSVYDFDSMIWLMDLLPVRRWDLNCPCDDTGAVVEGDTAEMDMLSFRVPVGRKQLLSIGAARCRHESSCHLQELKY
jgi:hypothetical protein